MKSRFSLRCLVTVLVLWSACVSALFGEPALPNGPRAARASGGSPKTFPVAMRTYGVWDADTKERFDFAVWYPGGSRDSHIVREGRSIAASANSRIIPGFYPVILLSHDTADGRFSNSDIAVALAGSGFVVIAPSHNGDSYNNSDKLYTPETLFARPRHLLRALDTLLGTQEFSLSIDESRIGLLGVGFGSLTVLQLAGAKPDFSLLPAYCSKIRNEDPFCAPWAAERLAQMPAGMAALDKEYGINALRPPLALFAPPLEAAPLPPPTVAVAEKPKKDEDRRLSFWQRFFSKETEEEEPAPEAEGQERAAAPLAQGAARELPALDFQGGPLFGGTDSGEPFVHIATPDSPEFRMIVAEDISSTLASPVPSQAKVTASLVYRRPAAVRRIGGIGLLLPAGGMLFTRASLSAVTVPVAIVEAENDGLYAPALHSTPYTAKLPVKPEVLRVKKADHFSLYAPCADELHASLREACGRLPEDERAAAAEQRDAFLVSFFQAVLGNPLPPAEPSGFVAEKNPDQPSPDKNATAPAVRNATAPAGNGTLPASRTRPAAR